MTVWLADPLFKAAWTAVMDAIAEDAELIKQGARPTHQTVKNAVQRVMDIVRDWGAA